MNKQTVLVGSVITVWQCSSRALMLLATKQLKRRKQTIVTIAICAELNAKKKIKDQANCNKLLQFAFAQLVII